MPFHKLAGAHLVIKTKGVYRQLDVYTFRGCYFAKRGTGFVHIYQRGTSFADDTLVEFVSTLDIWIGKLGSLRYEYDKDAKRLKERYIENASL